MKNSRQKIKWVIWSIDREGKVVSKFWYGFKPALSKIYKALNFGGNLKKFGFVSYESLEKSSFYADFDVKIKINNIL
tara:strand:+ start:469 stop:699 length:231 start_codon:yes stop_codon:yes gene_type:complete